MMSKASVTHSLKNIEKVYPSLIMDTNKCEIDNVISWANYKPGIISELSYPREYQLLLDSRQYTYLLKDNSFFQFFYNYGKKGDLIKCRLAYYPTPSFTKETAEDIVDYQSNASEWLSDILDEVAIDMLENDAKLTQNSHLRFDYDSSVESHSKCHLQFGGVNNFRISAACLVLPFAFFEKIVSDFKPDWLSEAKAEKVKKASLLHGISNAYIFDEKDIFRICR
ncbi:DUF2290 domain-containing protein [Vibrio cholerae]|nr:DUF2290 domain-containing protein [Vibrio cholerae]